MANQEGNSLSQGVTPSFFEWLSSPPAKKHRREIEHDMQVALFEWARLQENVHPELGLMFAIPNGGQRHVLVAKKMKAEGVRAGVPDIFLPVPRKNFHGLFLEMKAPGGAVRKNQKQWIRSLVRNGYDAHVVYSLDEAINEILDYLGPK